SLTVGQIGLAIIFARVSHQSVPLVILFWSVVILGLFFTGAKYRGVLLAVLSV
ncbi:unnamed protein product, partial [marine sediment metagenome]